MTKCVAAVIVILFCFVQAKGQTFVVQGKVTDRETGQPVPGASVFLSNTSVGTAANAKGEFVLHDIPAGKFDLVISSLGYETYVVNISGQQVSQPLVIQLKPKANELASVVVGNYEKDGWTRWGRTFLDDFVGYSFNAMSCDIKNYDVIKFRYSKKRNYLEAFADEPLVIQNKSLGYIVHYKLENFSHDFENNTISYEGFPLFEQMQGNARKLRKWKENRKEAYYGSVMHFMRCLYRNKLAENGYEVKRVQKIPNLEKKRIQALYKYLAGADGNYDFQSHLSQDSLNYYEKILAQPNETTILHNQLLPGDSIAYGADSITAVFSFTDYLQITYKNKKEPYEYTRTHTQDTPSGYIASLATLINGSPVYISYNGSYSQPRDMLTSGYWAWSEKMCNMLPFDYWP
ncbi:MAG TPA: carboxypeptidase-like regulatory domain-containing protein [Chitinophagaceae bacterium]|nr:carboxypeptidase-like regulatory domain-containing protein [Chitinophagaceae bacterium]